MILKIKQLYIKKFFSPHKIRILILSLNELKLIARSRGINDYKSMSKKRLLSALNKSETVNESEKNFDNARIKKIRKGFND